jgi:signal transduction histidine kinase
MSDFIEMNMELILSDWEHFATTLSPATDGMSRSELRDYAQEMLLALSQDMRTAQTDPQRRMKSHGSLDDQSSRVLDTAVEHAAERLSEGFNVDLLIAEYRALRASVVHHWREQLECLGEDELEELTRFHEAMDQSMAQAVNWFSRRTHESRDLLQGILAHDLGNPLSAIMMFSSVLLHDARLDPEHGAEVLRIRDGASRMKKMIDDLLDFTRARFGNQLPMSPHQYNLTSLCHQVVEELKVSDADVPIDFSGNGEIWGVVDAGRFGQMLSNLVANAIQHGFPHSPIIVTVGADEQYLLLSVHNFGVPISRQEQRYIFDPFKRAALRSYEENSRFAGLGLGLFIAHQIAKAHEGQIDVESSEERGTTFTVRLPRSRPA